MTPVVLQLGHFGQEAGEGSMYLAGRTLVAFRDRSPAMHESTPEASSDVSVLQLEYSDMVVCFACLQFARMTAIYGPS